MANATGYTRNQISYLLNQVLGLSFYQYVNQTRLQHLLGQLSGELPGRVDELAFAAGFNSLSAFYRCFRQHTGQSPREYLKRLVVAPLRFPSGPARTTGAQHLPTPPHSLPSRYGALYVGLAPPQPVDESTGRSASKRARPWKNPSRSTWPSSAPATPASGPPIT